MKLPHLPGQRKNLVILFFTIMVVNIGFGIILPILPYYAQNLGASASMLGLLSASYATLQFIFAPIWGRISDRIGRRPVLLVGLSGFAISFLVFGFASRLWMLFLARVISGILSSATLPTALAYIADTTPPENRARGMGLMGAASGLGMILGPAVGGFLSAIHIQIPFFASAGITILIFAFALIYLPESLLKTHRTAEYSASSIQINPFQRLMSGLQGKMAFFMIIATLTSLGMAQVEAIGALYAKARFGAGPMQMGLLFILVGGLGVFSQFVIVGPLIKKIGEQRSIQISLLGVGTSFLLCGLAETYLLGILGVLILGTTIALLRPALNTLVSRSAGPSRQGAALGTVSSFYSLGMMFGPVTGGLIFDWLGISSPFFFSAIIHLAVFAASWFLFPHPARNFGIHRTHHSNPASPTNQTDPADKI
ncbi:MAG TPA: MFS transporter [Anaerolineaceae bacterium]